MDPLLLLAFIEDLLIELKISTLLLHANDAKIKIEDSQLLQDDVSIFIHLATKNKKKMNLDKSQLIRLTNYSQKKERQPNLVFAASDISFIFDSFLEPGLKYCHNLWRSRHIADRFSKSFQR